MSVAEPSLDVADVLAECTRLEADGRLLDAVDLLDAADRTLRDAEIERRLVMLRHRAVPEVVASASSTPWPEVAPYDGPLRDGLPVVTIEELTAPLVRSAITTYGCILIPRVVPGDECATFIDAIDRGFGAVDRHAAGEDTGVWYEPFAPEPGMVPGAPSIAPVRLGRDSTLWSVDSPRLLQEICVLIDRVGLRSIVDDYLGERPMISAKKSNLRRVPLDSLYADWHQDGAFLGEGIRTLNVWITLNDCGVDSPGMDVVPMRFDEIVETGAEGAMFDWAVSPTTVAEVAGDRVLRPRFEAGDALLFDEFFLHRTACIEGMSRERYAIENWYFAPSFGYGNQVPLVY